MNTDEKDKLRSLFQEMKLDETSTEFENKLMNQIHITERKRDRLRNIKSYIAMSCGAISILSIPALIVWLLRLTSKTELPFIENGFKLKLPQLQFDPFIISIACVTLLLLIGDTLIRKYLREKKEKN